jgi:hypothetical protein
VNDTRCSLTAKQLAGIHDRVLQALSWAAWIVDRARQYDAESPNVIVADATMNAWRDLHRYREYERLWDDVQPAKFCFARTVARIGNVCGINYHEAVAYLVLEVGAALGPVADEIWLGAGGDGPEEEEEAANIAIAIAALPRWKAEWPEVRVELLKSAFDWYEARAALKREFLDAVERLTEAEQTEPAKAGSAKQVPGTPGRRQADYDTLLREGSFYDSWQQARDTGVYKADFAKENNMKLKDFDKLLNRVAARRKREKDSD